MVHCHLNIEKTSQTKKLSRVRNYKFINHNTLRNDLAKKLKDLPFLDAPVDDLVDIFEMTIGKIIDHHTPEVVKLRTTRTRFPWYNNSIKDERQVCRRLERK